MDAAWESERSVIELRRALEAAQEAELRAECARDVPCDGIALSSWMEQRGTLAHMREFVIHRAPYQLKEADPHSFAIPRLAAGRAKSALLKIQLDEYGNGEPGESHQELFAETMDALGVTLDIDDIPAVTLRTNTVLTMLGTHRRLVGALLGHLAVFETTSVEPMARYAQVLRQLLPSDVGTKAARFYDVHVAADAFHGRIAMEEMVAGFIEQYPDESDEVVFGGAAVTLVERELTQHLIDCWEAGRSSLRTAPSVRAAA